MTWLSCWYLDVQVARVGSQGNSWRCWTGKLGASRIAYPANSVNSGSSLVRSWRNTWSRNTRERGSPLQRLWPVFHVFANATPAQESTAHGPCLCVQGLWQDVQDQWQLEQYCFVCRKKMYGHGTFLLHWKRKHVNSKLNPVSKKCSDEFRFIDNLESHMGNGHHHVLFNVVLPFLSN